MGCADSRYPELKQNSIYEFEVVDIDRNPVSMSKYRGNVLLIVNVACGCGLTNKNYDQLNSLYSTYSEKGLRILGFPCNQFFGQESGSNEEIKNHVRNDLEVKFDLFSKIEINGKDAAEIYIFLRKNSTLKGGEIGWNFGKFLLDREGSIKHYFGPTKDPLEFENDIKLLLG